MVQTTGQPATNCLFCRKNIFEKSFYTTSRFSALYNIAPVLPGHSLVIPNNHYESLSELSDDELCEMMVFARRVTSVLKTVFNCDGFNWTIQDGISAGQTIPHLHLHIIPRKINDMNGAGEWYSFIPENEKQLIDSESRKKLDEKEYTTVTKRLKQAFQDLK